MHVSRPPASRRRPAERLTIALLAGAACLGGCATAEPKWSPGTLDEQRLQECRKAERAYRENAPDYPGLRDALMKDPVAISWFVRMLVNDLFKVRDLSAVREVAAESDDEGLLRKIEDPTEIRALAEIDQIGVAAMPVILNDLLRHSQPQPRTLGVELIGRIGRPALPALRELSHDADARHRRAAARAIAAIGFDGETLALMTELIADREYTVRADALRGLRRIGGAQAATLLRGSMQKDEDPFVRRQAALSLSGHPEPATAQALIEYLDRCLREHDSRGEDAAQQALETLAGTRSPRTVAAWRTWASTWQPETPKR